MYAHGDGVAKDFARDERRRKNYRLVSRPDGIEVGEKRTDWNVRTGVAPPEAFQTDPLFEAWRGELNYLDDPNAFSVSGLDKIFGKSATVNDRVDINEGNMFVCAYPSGNIAELTQTRLLYENIRE